MSAETEIKKMPKVSYLIYIGYDAEKALSFGLLYEHHLLHAASTLITLDHMQMYLDDVILDYLVDADSPIGLIWVVGLYGRKAI